jgi:GPH family glycoside/pentoside/hexuronide:cation symporter
MTPMQQALAATTDTGSAVSAAAPTGLSRWMMAGWGLGTLTPVVVFTATNALLLRFMTDDVGVGAGLAAGMIAASKAYDAFADPTMGVISDRTRSRWGRRRPYIFAGALMLALSMVALFAPPNFATQPVRTAYMAVMLMVYATAYTLFNIPYMAMPAEMTTDYNARSSLMSYRVVAVGISILLASSLGPMVIAAFGGGRAGHSAMAFVLAPIVVMAGLGCFAATRHAPATGRSPLRPKLGAEIRSLVANRPYLVLLAVKFLTLATLGAQAVFPYFFTRILKVTDNYLGIYFLCNAVTLMASQPFWLFLSKRTGKKIAFMVALGGSIPAWLSWYLASPSEPLAILLGRGVLLGALGGGALLMGQSLLPDTMEYDYLTTGLRREGLFAGFYTTMEKFSGAIGIACVGAALAASGYVQSAGKVVVQPASALHAIRLIISLFPSGLCAVALAMLLFYHLSAEELARLRSAARA